jgi:hypothetical protein
MDLVECQYLTHFYRVFVQQHRSPSVHHQCIARIQVCLYYIICTIYCFITATGHCNNVKQPRWGASFEPLSRGDVNPDYADGLFVCLCVCEINRIHMHIKHLQPCQHHVQPSLLSHYQMCVTLAQH